MKVISLVQRSSFTVSVSVVCCRLYKSIIRPSQHQDAHIIWGGDFTVDFSRNWTDTKILDDYCEQVGLYPVYRHSNSTIDYTHHFNIKYFSQLDHFIVFEQLYQASVCKQFVFHDVSSGLLGIWFDFSLFFVSMPCARLSWPTRQLLSARPYRIV